MNISEAFTTLEDHVKLLQPDPATCVTPPIQPWFDGLIPSSNNNNVEGGGGDANSAYAPGGEFHVPATEEEVEEVMRSAKQFKEVGAAHQQLCDMLTEDCSHLLRKAQAAQTKAQR